MKRILIVDDDVAICKLLQATFENADFSVTCVTSGLSALARFESATFDVLVLDVMMPGMSGIELTKKLRLAGNLTPILILTARDDDEARIDGLEAGADDYCDKTLPMREIVQRVHGLIRRHQHYDKAQFVSADSFVLDAKNRSVTSFGTQIELTSREYELLEFLSARAGEIVSRDELLTHFWGIKNSEVETRTIDVLVGRLRKKLGGRYIRSKRGFGYIFDEDFTD
ncbi:MAG: response regulator transcription factor [Streptococcaceae bacterium]|jgi:DNA-binding response OmpR family regulator|nr:response regulator transcription factor [Streptococcaceae bacterium]